jgi:sec-independent protein translocase protein TatA
MDFLGIGGWEILLVLIIALLIWGPGRVVEVGRTLGKWVRILRKATSDLTAQVTKELDRQEKEPPPPQYHKGDKPVNE